MVGAGRLVLQAGDSDNAPRPLVIAASRRRRELNVGRDAGARARRDGTRIAQEGGMKTLHTLVRLSALAGLASLVLTGTGCAERAVVRTYSPPPARVVVVRPVQPVVTERVYVR